MAARFQIREFDSDPFDEEEQRAGGQRSEGESDSGNVEPHLGAARGRRVEAPETVDFEAGVPVARRMTLPEEELLDDVSMFRGRTQSEPPNFWLAVRYGRELRRMSDEFLSTYSENQRIHVSRSAGAIMGTVYRKIVCYLPGKGNAASQKSDNC